MIATDCCYHACSNVFSYVVLVVLHVQYVIKVDRTLFKLAVCMSKSNVPVYINIDINKINKLKRFALLYFI